MDSEDQQILRFRLPSLARLCSAFKSVSLYASGALLAAAFWLLMDAALYSKYAYGGKVNVGFVDWIPAICSFFGMIVINSIDRDLMIGDTIQLTGSGDAWKARLVVFLGFALLAGGMAGSITVLILKYIVPGYNFPTVGFGVGNVISNALILSSSIILWLSGSNDDFFPYSLTL